MIVGRRAAITPALPSWYFDLTDEHPLVIKHLQMPVVSGIVDVRLQPCRPRQVIAAALVMSTYPVLLFVSVISPIARFVRSATRLFVRAFALEPPTSPGTAPTHQGSVERVNQSIARVGQLIDDTWTGLDRCARQDAPTPAVPRPRRPVEDDE